MSERVAKARRRAERLQIKPRRSLWQLIVDTFRAAPSEVR